MKDLPDSSVNEEQQPLLANGGGSESYHSQSGGHGPNHGSISIEPTARKRLTRRASYRFSECDPDEDLPQFKGKRSVQYFAALAANMGALSLGTVLSWSAVALPDLRDDVNFQNLTLTEESWIGSIITLGSVAAGPLAGGAIEGFGRRKTMLILSIPLLLGWLLIFFAQSLPIVYLGRFTTGFCAGVFTIAAPIFTAEMADVEIRGVLCAGFDMMISVGILFIFVIGAFLNWRLQSLACASIPAIMFFMLLAVPESPRYLVQKGRTAEAIEALIKFRGASFKEQVEPELAALKAASLQHASKSLRWRELIKGPVIRPVSVAFFIYFFQVVTGIDPVLFYTVDIFKSAQVNLDEYYSTIIIGVIQVVSAAAGALVVDHFGRRPLLLLSEACMVVSLAAFGGYFYFKDNGQVDGLDWLPLTCLTIYVVSYSVGVGPVGYMIMGEILPQHVKGLAACFLTCAKWGMSFAMTKFFNDLILFLGEDGAYWSFSISCFIGFIYIYLYVPETKGKTLDEVQLAFQDLDSIAALAIASKRSSAHSVHSVVSNPIPEDTDC